MILIFLILFILKNSQIHEPLFHKIYFLYYKVRIIINVTRHLETPKKLSFFTELFNNFNC